MADDAITILRPARRVLDDLPPGFLSRIIDAVDRLASDPRPTGAKALQGGHGLLRIRIGDYRVVYYVDDATRRVTVTRIGHRGDVYR